MKDIFEKLKTFLFVIPLALIILFLFNPFVIIPSGYVGVKRTFGKIDLNELNEGIHFIIPLIQTVEKVEVRTRAIEFTGSKGNEISSLSKDGLPIQIDITVLYRVNPQKAAELLKEYGSDFDEKIIKQVIRTSTRNAVSEMESSVVYQERDKLHQKIYSEVAVQLEKRYISLEDIMIRDIRLPKAVVEAIEQKRRAYEEAQRMQFILEKEKIEAERKKVEAEGIAKANQIIANSLTREYLTWKFIENIQEYAKSQNNTIIILPYDSKLMPMINIPQQQR